MLLHAVGTTCACSGRARCPPVLPQIIDHQFEVSSPRRHRRSCFSTRASVRLRGGFDAPVHRRARPASVRRRRGDVRGTTPARWRRVLCTNFGAIWRPPELVMASCFEELTVEALEITPGPRTGGRATGPAHFWRRLAFAGLRNCSACTPYIISATARGRRGSRRPVPDRFSGPSPRSLIAARPPFSIF
jgi:hypothetical protein